MKAKAPVRCTGSEIEQWTEQALTGLDASDALNGPILENSLIDLVASRVAGVEVCGVLYEVQEGQSAR